MPIYIIAEAGVNHNGSLKMALKLVDVAASAGADAVKFQTFRTENVITRHAVKAAYQEAATGPGESQFEMVKKLELGKEEHRAIKAHCRKRKIDFLSTPFDIPSAKFLAAELRVPRIKIPSGEITNAPLLLGIAKFNRPVILSTGMSTLPEIRKALEVLAFGYLGAKGKPSQALFSASYRSAPGRRAIERMVTLLHCTTEYPAPFTEVNLLAMDTLRKTFGLPVGYSDHTTGISVPIAAAARGAVVIEKHFTLDRDLPGPDHKASLEPAELERMVRSIREVNAALGTGHKTPSRSEFKNLPIARKSLVAANPIAKGELFSEENLIPKRPGTGLSPFRYWDLLGRRADRDYSADEAITSNAYRSKRRD